MLLILLLLVSMTLDDLEQSNYIQKHLMISHKIILS